MNFFNEKMDVTFMNSVACNWPLAAEFLFYFYFLWRIMEFMAVSKWNSNGKDVNSQPMELE